MVRVVALPVALLLRGRPLLDARGVRPNLGHPSCPRHVGASCSVRRKAGDSVKRLKRAYDSDKVFRLNQNIGPD
jgi:hypothetical protein